MSADSKPAQQKALGRFKNVFGDVWKEKLYNLDFSKVQPDGNNMTMSGHHMAAIWHSVSGGLIGSVSLGDINKNKPEVIYYWGHKGAVHDVNFSPFYDTIFASGSDDGTLKIWEVPPVGTTPEEGEDEVRKEAVATFIGHEKRVSTARWHPSMDWLIATAASDKTVKIWDLLKSEAISTTEVKATCNQAVWNYSGSLLGVATKDKRLAVVDPRSKHVVADWTPHNSVKPFRVEWLPNKDSDSPYIVSTGFGQSAERELCVWDSRNYGKPTARAGLDRQASYPQTQYDEGTGILYVYGRGESNIRLFMHVNGGIYEMPGFSNQPASTATTFVPRRYLAVQKTELARCFREEHLRNVSITSFYLPRRSSEFNAEAFPPCPSGLAAAGPEKYLTIDVIPKPPLLSLADTDGSFMYLREPNFNAWEKWDGKSYGQTGGAIPTSGALGTQRGPGIAKPTLPKEAAVAPKPVAAAAVQMPVAGEEGGPTAEYIKALEQDNDDLRQALRLALERAQEAEMKVADLQGEAYIPPATVFSPGAVGRSAQAWNEAHQKAKEAEQTRLPPVPKEQLPPPKRPLPGFETAQAPGEGAPPGTAAVAAAPTAPPPRAEEHAPQQGPPEPPPPQAVPAEAVPVAATQESPPALPESKSSSIESPSSSLEPLDQEAQTEQQFVQQRTSMEGGEGMVTPAPPINPPPADTQPPPQEVLDAEGVQAEGSEAEEDASQEEDERITDTLEP